LPSIPVCFVDLGRERGGNLFRSTDSPVMRAGRRKAEARGRRRRPVGPRCLAPDLMKQIGSSLA
jgi:hypothetical protein